MANPEKDRIRIFGVNFRVLSIALTSTIVLVLTVVAPSSQAQTFTVIHTFTGGVDGAIPLAGLTMNAAGDLYGTAAYGGSTAGTCGSAGCGTAFKLTHKSEWIFSPLYSFAGGADGTLYGTTSNGGQDDLGTVYHLRPKPTICRSTLCLWQEAVLYAFHGDSTDGHLPQAGVVFDRAGNLYGTTVLGGSDGGLGTVYELSPSGGGWIETILHTFGGPPDGGLPFSDLILDNAGNLYGTTSQGGGFGGDFGTVYELMPSGGGWTESTLHSFNGSDGDGVYAGLIFDQSGNLYGTASGGGPDQDDLGTVFELTPSGGGWNFNLLYAFPVGVGQANGPMGSLLMDAAGNLYGTGETGGAYGYGAVFKLTPQPDGTWTYLSLHDFTGELGVHHDGGHPYGKLVLDANGNLYGTASIGGDDQNGTVWMITP